MNRCLLILLAGITSTMASGQDDPESVVATVNFNKGIYLTFDNFITNTPISPDQVKSEYDDSDRDFYFQLAKEKQLRYIEGGHEKDVAVRNIWGYSDGKAVF